MRRYALLSSTLVAGLLACGDQGGDDPLQGEPSFAAVPRDPEHGAQQAVSLLRQQLGPQAAPDLRESGAGDSFYLAIHKRELGQKYFLSAFLRLYHAGTVRPGSTRSMGTRVVTFRASNNRLFIVRADDQYAASDTFTPDAVMVEAFPIIHDYGPFQRLPGAKNYVLVDPAAGLSRMTLLLSDAFGSARFERDVSYLHKFRRIADGVTYENVVMGHANVPTFDTGFRATATLGIALRRYREGPSFRVYQPGPMDPSYFFLSGPLLEKNVGQTRYVAVHWDVGPVQDGAIQTPRTIEWVLSPLLPAKYQKAVEEGVKSWNAVFGQEVLTTRIGTDADDPGQDDQNYIIYDGDPSLGAAYANWRTNPNTGEIRGASVYINRAWFDGADTFTDDAMGARPAPPQGDDELPRTRVLPQLHWDGVTDGPLCVLWAEEERVHFEGDTGQNLTGAEKGQRYIRHVIAHEIGHDLGLRHNFKGSLKWAMGQPGSTVMDYQTSAERILLDRPGSYDRDAIRLLYGLSMSRPVDPFCTDGGVRTDPECQQFDSRADPLVEYWQPSYNNFVTAYLNGTSPIAPNNSLNNVLMFVRAGKSSAQRVQAWNFAIEKVATTAPVPMPTPAGYGARRDFLARRILSRLWLEPANVRGTISVDPPMDPELLALWLPELRGNLLNIDGLRSYPTRRVAVDVLKKLQLVQAQAVLREARGALAAQLPMLSGETLLLHRDLLSRVEAALSPYFVH